MPRFTMNPQQNEPVPTRNLQSQQERQNNHQSFRFWQCLQTNLNIEQGEKHNEQSLDLSEIILYVGNHSPAVTEKDLFKLFSFKIILDNS